MLKLISAVVLLLSLPALANLASNTVPTNQLTAIFQVMTDPKDATHSVAVVELRKVVVTDGKVVTTPLDQSADDVVTLSNGVDQITYNPQTKDANRLRTIGGATYTANFTRFNGEKYGSTVVMPQPIAIHSPQAEQVFSKKEDVVITWDAAPYDGALFVLGSTCTDFDFGKTEYNATFTALAIRGGAASNCADTVQMQFAPMFIKVGRGFGQMFAIATTSFKFGYGVKLSNNTLALPVQHQKIRDLIENSTRQKIQFLNQTLK